MQHDLLAIIPELMLIATAVVILLVDPLLPPNGRHGLSYLGVFACLMAALSTYFLRNEEFTAFNNSIALDRFAIYFKVLFLVIAIIILLISEKHLDLHRRLLGDYYALVLLATVGMIIMAEAIDIMTFFVGLELMALASYILAGFFRYEELSVEASIKYFLTGAFASGFILFGMVLLYGLTGATNYQEIGDTIAGGSVSGSVLVVAIMLLIVGFGFKVGAVPFHNWAPDVLQGSPTPVAAFLAVGPKVAGFAAIVKFFTIMLGSESAKWTGLIIVVAIVTMLVGSTMALVQRDLKRMLAYSSIAHVGYLLLAVVAMGEGNTTFSSSAILFYLAAYSMMNLGAFGVLVYLANNCRYDYSLDGILGLGRQYRMASVIMTLFMLSLAGIPPTAGFFAKFYLFAAVVDAGLAWLAIVGVLFSVISAYYYLRVIVYMYMRDTDVTLERTPHRSFDLNLGLALATVAVVLLGILPSPVLNAAQDAILRAIGF
ncbi:MAG TPA: NADH-quinone oxidoreductase subunit N [Actinobacteria bacterium]|nr:NADH-quinone oxidoreductase subunit N [Actinomycetota bacterium]